MQAWFARWGQIAAPQAPPRPPALRIDAEVLARQHPAWRLADALERGLAAPDAPQIVRAMRTNAALNGAGFDALRWPLELAPGDAPSTQPASTISVEMPDIAARQRADWQRFFALDVARQQARRREQTLLARRDLEDAARILGGTVAELDLSLLPPDVILELTNLRLKLVENLSKTRAQREAARAQIAAIEARYAQIWREQTARQNALLHYATVERPAQQRQLALARLSREVAAAAQRESAARDALRSQFQAVLRADEAARAPLRLALPPVRAVAVAGLSNPPRARSLGTRENPDELLQTKATPRASTATSSGKALAATTLARQLRAKARRDARQWAILVAARLGGRWSSDSGAPDRTDAALSLLSGR